MSRCKLVDAAKMHLRRRQWIRISTFTLTLVLLHCSPNWALAEAGKFPSSYLVEQLHFWESRYNDPNLKEILDKLFKVVPNHSEGLAVLARLQIREGKYSLARKTLLRLGQTKKASEKQIRQLETTLKVHSEEKRKLNRARLLAKSGRHKEAVQLFKKLFPFGPPGWDLAFEYWQIMVFDDVLEETVLHELSKLSDQHPDNIRFRLGYFSHYLENTALPDPWFSELNRYADDYRFGYEAKALWRRALKKRPLSDAQNSYLNAYLSRFPEDGEISTLYERRGRRLRLAKQSGSDPYYQAKLKGVEALNQGDFPTAEKYLISAYKKYPKDIELVEALGYLRMRQGRHQEALIYFTLALKMDSDNASQWKSLIATTQFWDRIAKAKQAMDDQRFDTAQRILTSLAQKDANDINNHIEILLLNAHLATAQKKYTRAGDYFRRVINIEALHNAALRSYINLYADRHLMTQALELYQSYGYDQQLLVEDLVADLELNSLKRKADMRLARGDYRKAILLFESILRIEPQSPWIRYKLAKIFFKRGYPQAGKILFIDKLEQISETNLESQPTMRYAYALYLSSLDLNDLALLQLNAIPLKQRSSGALELLERLEFDQLIQRALSANKEGAADEWMARANTIAQNDPQRLFRLVRTWQTMNQPLKALGVLMHRFKKHLVGANSIHGDVLVRRCEIVLSLGDIEPCESDLRELERLSASSDGFRKTYQVSVIELWLQYSKMPMVNPQRTDEMHLKLLTLLLNADLTNKEKAYFWVERGDFLADLRQYSAAIVAYDAALAMMPNLPNGLLGKIAVLDKMGKHHLSSQQVNELFANNSTLSIIQKIELSRVLIEFSQTDRAQILLESILIEDAQNPLALRMAGQLAEHQRDYYLAQQYYFQALLFEEKVFDARNQNDNVETKKNSPSLDDLLATHEFNDWPARNTKSRLLALREKNLGHVNIAYDFRRRSGTEGQSTTHWTTVPIEIQLSLFKKRLVFLRIDSVKLDSGAVDYVKQLDDAEQFGTLLLCSSRALGCPVDEIDQRAEGVALGIGYRGDQWDFDLGTRPLGFLVQDWVGGIEYSMDWRQLGLYIDLEKRPVTSTLLSYAGAKDPVTGKTWGGIYSLGLTAGLSYDPGKLFGIWASLEGHQLDGENVLANNRARFLTGLYWRIFQRESFNVDVGLALMKWRFKYDLGEFTLGHGGYYSPNDYVSASFPVSVYGRVNRFAYLLRLSTSVSTSEDEDAVFFPNDPELQSEAQQLTDQTGVDPVYLGGQGSGAGYSIRAVVEYQLTKQLYMGAEVEIERSDFYEPNRGVMWMRYLFGPTFLPIPYAAEAIKLYSEF